jgi:hypothetical protein
LLGGAVNKTLFAMLTETESRLLLDAEPKAIRDLDEDDLVTLHDRVRRARNKYSTLYRRRARERVAKDATRGRAHAVNARTARKVELFEDALARVSRQLARSAAASAKQLKAERLQAVERPARQPSAAPRRAVAKATKSGHVQSRTPARKRGSAQARAATRRKQAARGLIVNRARAR